MKISEIYNKIMTEVSSDVYNLVRSDYSDSRIIMSKDDEIRFTSISSDRQEVRTKPKGLWYGIGTSWINWVRSEMPEWEVENIFSIDINESGIKIIRGYDELLEFDNEYGVNESFYRAIDWGRVSMDYDGIEIAPYINKARLDRKVSWYYGWDVASGCIWGDGIIRGIKRLN
jgi:hypothetical protein